MLQRSIRVRLQLRFIQRMYTVAFARNCKHVASICKHSGYTDCRETLDEVQKLVAGWWEKVASKPTLRMLLSVSTNKAMFQVGLPYSNCTSLCDLWFQKSVARNCDDASLILVRWEIQRRTIGKFGLLWQSWLYEWLRRVIGAFSDNYMKCLELPITLATINYSML
jgi:hypothetical protein